jgi:hypothetical protein
VALRQENNEERAARIDMLLEELRLNTEDMQELAEQARRRAIESRRETRLTISDARRRQAALRAGRKR